MMTAFDAKHKPPPYGARGCDSEMGAQLENVFASAAFPDGVGFCLAPKARSHPSLGHRPRI